MSTIRPFKGVRPLDELAEKIIDRNEFYAYHDISSYYQGYLGSGRLIQDPAESYYIYRFERTGRTHTGLWALTDPIDLVSGQICPHEHIIAQKAAELVGTFLDQGLDFNPILLTYDSQPGLDALIRRLCLSPPVFSYRSIRDSSETTLWIISQPGDLSAIEKEMIGIQPVYLADGHHRASAFLTYLASKPASLGGVKGAEAGISSIYFPLPDMDIKAYHRIFHLHGPETYPEIMGRVDRYFWVEPIDHFTLPRQRHRFTMVTSEQKIFGLTLKELDPLPALSPESLLEMLDASLVHDIFYQKCLGPDVLAGPQGVEFVGGQQSWLTTISKVYESKASVGMFLFPCDFEHIRAISGAGLHLPPKSTYFEPKVASGLIIHELPSRL